MTLINILDPPRVESNKSLHARGRRWALLWILYLHMNNNYLCHHGIKGQKWGVRNGPPYPIQNDYISRDTRINKNNKAAINEIFDTMSTKDKKLLWPGWKKGQKFFGDNEYDNGGIAYSIVQKHKGKPVSFLIAGVQEYNGMRYGDVGLGVRNDSSYRGKGNAKKMAKYLVDWYDKGNHDLDFLFWYSREDNPGSYKAALANGFEIERKEVDLKGDGNKWIYMRYPPKK